MQMKTTRRYHFIPIRLAKIWSLTMPSCRGCGETGSLLLVGTQIRRLVGRAAWQFPTRVHRPFYAEIPPWELILLLVPAMFKYHAYKGMHGSAVLTNKLMETTQVGFTYRGLVKRVTAIIHCKARLWTNSSASPVSAETYIPASLPRPTKPGAPRRAQGSVFPQHLRVLLRLTKVKQWSKLLYKIREKGRPRTGNIHWETEAK